MDNQNKTKFNQWVQLTECKTLKPNQRIILISILNLHNIEGWDFTPLSVLNERSGIGKTALKENISKLCELELVEKLSNHNRKKYGKAPNDYVPNYTNILNLLNSQVVGNRPLKDNQIVGNRPFKDNQIVGKRPINRSENDHLLGRKTTIRIIEEKKEKNNSLYYSTYNDSTRRYMVYPDNDNKQKTNDMDIIITNNTENENPINDLQVFDFSDGCENPNSLEVLAAERDKTENAADRSAAINPKDAETAYEYAMIGYNTNTKTALNSPKTAGATEIAHSEVLSMQVDSYPTHAEKTPQEQNIGGNGTGDKTAEDNDNTKTTETNTDSPNCDLLGFNEADLGDGDSPTTTEETATECDKSQEAQINGRGEVLASNVDSYSTETEKTPQGRNKEGNLEIDTAAEDTHSPNEGENTAPTTNTLSMEETQRIMSQAAQTIMKNRKHADADTQNAPNNDRSEEITPQADNYTTAAEKTPQGAKNSGMAADTAATEHKADTAARPIFNTIRTAAEWKVRHGNDTCWEETFEHAAEGLEAPLEDEIRTLLNQVYKDWQNHAAAINTKMINDMKVYAERRYGIILTSKEKKAKKDTVNYCIPRHDAVPTADEIENIDLCHIFNNRDILNILSAGCTRLDTVILSLNKGIEFTQIYRIATPQQYDCVSNAMALIDKYPTVSDKKAKYITDLAIHLCDMLDKTLCRQPKK